MPPENSMEARERRLRIGLGETRRLRQYMLSLVQLRSSVYGPGRMLSSDSLVGLYEFWIHYSRDDSFGSIRKDYRGPCCMVGNFESLQLFRRVDLEELSAGSIRIVKGIQLLYSPFPKTTCSPAGGHTALW